MKASESPFRNLDWISTGLAPLDKILGGGVPSRKITELSGKFSVGKSTLALSVVSEAQKKGKPCLWGDIEFSFDEQYAKALGVELLNLDLIQEELAETAIDEIEKWASENKNGLIVLDAVGGLLTMEEAQKNANEKTIGGQAKLVATHVRKMVPKIALNNHAYLMLNHEFTDIMTGKIKTSGGAKLEYHKSIWLALRKMPKQLTQGENRIGDVIEAHVKKNKLAPTLSQKCELNLLYGFGFDRNADALQNALDNGTITQKGRSYFFADEKIAVGMPALREWFKENAERTLP